LYIVSAVVGVDAELTGTSVDENRIISRWREISADDQNQLRDRVDEILRPLGFETRLLVMDRAESIALCFLCMELSAVMSLRDQWQSGQLKNIVQSLFTFLLGATHPAVLVKRLAWALTDYERSLMFFSSIQGISRSFL